MKCIKFILKSLIPCIFIFAFSCVVKAQSDFTDINKNYNLGIDRTPEIQHFSLTSECITYALNGERSEKDTYRIYLKCVPAGAEKAAFDEYTCLKFTIQYEDSAELSIPALENWTYKLEDGMDEQNQVFGIDHSKFENLIDINGNAIRQDKAYHVYNAFVDFHAFCNVFANPVSDGNGIQNLHHIGQKIIHAAANSKAPTNLGSNIAPGSFFKNGEITLEFKGLSIVNNRQCALVGFDSGESSFKMIMSPMPNMEITTVGGSHYFGDIHKDLISGWVQKVEFSEIVVSETTLPMPPNKINSVVERRIIILNGNERETKQ